jgi:hypothetical protein
MVMSKSRFHQCGEKCGEFIRPEGLDKPKERRLKILLAKHSRRPRAPVGPASQLGIVDEIGAGRARHQVIGNEHIKVPPFFDQSNSFFGGRCLHD